MEKLNLDELDEQDDERIVKTVFNYIRSGEMNQVSFVNILHSIM